MSKTLFLIFNHTFTKMQEEDARSSLGVDRVVSMPDELGRIWGNIAPDLAAIADVLEPIQEWLKKEAADNDCVLVQGDFGACFLMVNFAFDQGLKPVYATTMREAAEELHADGSVKMTHRFRHVRFRAYGE
jgi:hypothetical protein